MDDKSWNDYLTGLNTGVAFGLMGEIGKSHRWEPPPPPPFVPEQRQSQPVGLPYDPGPRAFDPPPPVRPARPKPEDWWSALRQFELHEHLAAKGRRALDRVACSWIGLVGFCLLVLAGALYGYFGIESQQQPWAAALMFGSIAALAPFVTGFAILAVLYVLGAILSIALALAIAAFWLGLAGGAIYLCVVVIGLLAGS